MLEVMFLPKCKVNESSDFAFFLNKEGFIPLCISPTTTKKTPQKHNPQMEAKNKVFWLSGTCRNMSYRNTAMY